MYYLKCKHCNHLNEVKSEYLVVCGLCNRKLEDNYKDWKVKHPEKSFEDFQREVCLTEEQVKKGDTIKPTGKRGNKKGVIVILRCWSSNGTRGHTREVRLLRPPRQ